MNETAASKVEPELVAELEARRLLVTVEDREEAKVLVIVCDEQQVEISSEFGTLRKAAGGFEELATKAQQVADLLWARAEEPAEELDWWTPPEIVSAEQLVKPGDW
jgi:hypothetical protein